MREILFRGKRVDTGEWVEGYLYRLHEHTDPFIQIKNGGGEAYGVHPETVGQFTGLLDKNGVKIFEGDVIWFGSDGAYGREIKSYQGGFGYEGIGGDEIGFVGHNHFDNIMSSIHVIGSIHDKEQTDD